MKHAVPALAITLALAACTPTPPGGYRGLCLSHGIDYTATEMARCIHVARGDPDKVVLDEHYDPYSEPFFIPGRR